MLSRVSGPRLRHEIELILQEKQPETVLRRLHQLGVLSEIHTSLRWDDALDRKFQSLRAMRAELPRLPAAMERLYFALWVFQQTSEAHQSLIQRLRLTTATAKLITECERLRARLPQILVPQLADSELDALLSPFGDAALLVARAAVEDPIQQQRLTHYCQHLRPRQIHLSGEDLRALGVKPGPIYRKIFQQVRAALLDGHIHTPEDERELARQILAKPTISFNPITSSDTERKHD
jgi:tRNA nucleotidyltransferase (CCA-adding enzyme)